MRWMLIGAIALAGVWDVPPAIGRSEAPIVARAADPASEASADGLGRSRVIAMPGLSSAEGRRPSDGWMLAAMAAATLLFGLIAGSVRDLRPGRRHRS